MAKASSQAFKAICKPYRHERRRVKSKYFCSGFTTLRYSKVFLVLKCLTIVTPLTTSKNKLISADFIWFFQASFPACFHDAFKFFWLWFILRTKLAQCANTKRHGNKILLKWNSWRITFHASRWAVLNAHGIVMSPTSSRLFTDVLSYAFSPPAFTSELENCWAVTFRGNSSHLT